MKKHILRILCLMLTLVLVAGIGFTATPIQATEPTASASELDIQSGVTLHCWNWSFNEITANLDTIAALGYTAIQTSPIQAAKEQSSERPVNANWWVFYQPASFEIDNADTSALGTKADFQKMCKAAHEKGIKVIVDVVANHMGNATSNDLAETIIPDLRNDDACWHDYSKDTTNYNDRYNITQYCMAGLPDLNTSNKKVQNYVLSFLKECIDAGADGFRFDGAKHIETPDDGNCASDFWPTVINGAVDYAKSSRDIDLYCYGEVLDAPGGSLPVSAYTKYMSVTDNSWGASVLSNVVGKQNAGAYSANYHKSASADQLVVWAESHDDYAADSGHTRDVSEENVNKAWALVAAREGAMGLYLARPANMSQYLGAASITGWSYPEVAAVNKFHTAFAGQSEYVAKEGSIAYIERGNAGVVLVNCNGNEADISVTANAMADGTYTDAISGNSFTVADGKISGKIGVTGIAVVYDTEACAHEEHNTDGFCTACSAQVGHEYGETGTCACGQAATTFRTVYFINNRGWNKVNFYSWYTATDIFSDAWPGTPMTLVEGKVYSCSVPVDIPYIIFNNTSTQTTDLELPDLSSGLNLYDFTTDTWSAYSGSGTPDIDTNPTPDVTPDATTPGSTEPQATAPNGQVEGVSFFSSPIIWIAVSAAVIAIAAVVILLVSKKKG